MLMLELVNLRQLDLPVIVDDDEPLRMQERQQPLDAANRPVVVQEVLDLLLPRERHREIEIGNSLTPLAPGGGGVGGEGPRLTPLAPLKRGIGGEGPRLTPLAPLG